MQVNEMLHEQVKKKKTKFPTSNLQQKYFRKRIKKGASQK